MLTETKLLCETCTKQYFQISYFKMQTINKIQTKYDTYSITPVSQYISFLSDNTRMCVNPEGFSYINTDGQLIHTNIVRFNNTAQ